VSDDPRLSHLAETGEARMVDVGDKSVTDRRATAVGAVLMQPATLALIVAGEMKKGDVLGTARLAGIMAAKRTAELIPLCHPLALTQVTVDLETVVDAAADERIPYVPGQPSAAVFITAMCRVMGQTGVEMEALTAASVAGLTLYDMGKAVDRGMVITGVRVVEKVGGKSGEWRAP